MKLIPRLSLVCLLVTLPLLAQNPPAPPAIASIQPNVADSSGGTLVTITGERLSLPVGFACVLPCPTTVRFGSALVEAIHEDNNRITVRSPEHAAGTVDVTLTTGDGRSTTEEDAFTFVTDGEPGYASLLLPIYLDGTVAGDRGSMWRADFWIRNNSTTTGVTLAPWICPQDQVCPPVFPLTRTLLPAETLHNLPAVFHAPSANPGRMLYVLGPDTHQVSTSLRVFDTSRAELDAGAEIPVLREADMLTTTAHLLSVPIDQNFRLHLRVYDIKQRESSFHVRVYIQQEGVDASGSAPAPLLQVTLNATTAEEGPFRIRPAYAEYTGFGQLLDLDIPLERIRIEVEPQTPGSLFWTFVAITNNETQRLTIVTP